MLTNLVVMHRIIWFLESTLRLLVPDALGPGSFTNDLLCILSKYSHEPGRAFCLLFSDTNEQITHRDKSQPENGFDNHQIQLIMLSAIGGQYFFRR